MTCFINLCCILPFLRSTKFSRLFLPKAWCIDNSFVEKYVSFINDIFHVSFGRLITVFTIKNETFLGEDCLKFGDRPAPQYS